MAPKKRNKENTGLPRRWRYRYSAYYYMVPPGQEHKWDNKKEFRLGTNLSDAHHAYAERIGDVNHELKHFSQLCERYLVEWAPTKAKGTREQYQLAIKRLKPSFGHMLITAITPQHAYQYHDGMLKSGKSIASARADIATFRHMLTMAVRWGAIARNPLMGQLRLPTYKAPERYLEDWELDEILSVSGPGRGVKVLVPYCEFKMLTGLRRSDILRMTLSAAQEDGIHCQPHKTKNSSGKRLVFAWTPELRASWDRILAMPPRRHFPNSPLFCTRKGEPYMNEEGDCDGFDSMWQRFQKKVKKDTTIKVHFTEKDLRAKHGSDRESDADAAHALGNSEAVARKSYRRKPTVVTPLARKSNFEDKR